MDIIGRSSCDGYGNNGARQPRPPSPPDSGYEQDWPADSAISAGDDITSDLSESSASSRSSTSGGGGAKKVTGRKVMANGHPPPVKGVHGQDSDVDSGIVSCRKSGTRIGSTSSADTDSSRETRRKAEYSLQDTASDSKCNSPNFRRSSSGPKPLSAGPVKGDHSVLKECNRRPPTPLTVFPESHCVRFDEHLHLSEQNIRRSCRKLFATLYAQRFSYPPHNFNDLSKAPPKPLRLREAHGKYIYSTFNAEGHTGSVPGSMVQNSRLRSYTVPESELRKQRTNFRNSAPVTTSHRCYRVNLVNKENNAFEVGTNSNPRKTVSLRNPAIMRTSQKASSEQDLSLKERPYSLLKRGDNRLSPDSVYCDISKSSASAPFRTLSTDSGLGECRTNRCTCQNGTSSVIRPSSQSITPFSSRTNHRVLCSRCESPGRSLAKSNSCTVLSSNVSFPSNTAVLESSNVRRKLSSSNSPALQKTSSCSNLYQRTPFNHVTNVPIYSDNMIQAYAQVASVVPDEAKKDKLASATKFRPENIYNTIKSSPSSTIPFSSSSLQTLRYEQPKNVQRTSIKHETSSQEASQQTCVSSANSSQKKESKCVRGSDPRNKLDDEKVPKKKQYPEYVSNGLMPLKLSSSSGCSHSSLYLKPALKQSQKAASHSNVAHGSSTPDALSVTNGDVRLSEVEYAVIDKSKKNRFTSLPALNRFSSNPQIIGEDRDHNPPIPPKKHLHKSDFALHRSRSSSPKKSFIERVQGFTRSAKNAVQRAFSTERIYRPEMEERLEATGQKLRRSKSFIRGLRVSMNRKKRKNKPPMAEVVPQASSNPVWDECPSGPNSVVHVRGQLLQLNLDGSQVIELSKPQSKPYGFFVARGRVKSSRGVFVSRMRDQETQKHLAGLLDIGDEILEVESFSVKDSDIMEVNNLMANKNTLILTVLPYICRKDI